MKFKNDLTATHKFIEGGLQSQGIDKVQYEVQIFTFNTIITVFLSISGKFTRGLSNDRAFEAGAITEGKSPVHNEKQLLLYLLPGYVDQIETKLFEFSRDTNKEELKMKKTTSLCNGFLFQWHDIILQWLLASKTAVFYK